jgi:acetyl esterase
VTAIAPDVAAFYAEAAMTYPLRNAQATGVAELRAIGERLPPDAQPPVERVSDHEVDGPAGPVRVRVYRPGSADVLPACIWVHGGGWTLGGIEGTDLHARSLAVAAGCAVVSVDHRHAPEHRYPAALEDVCAAVRWVFESGRDIGIDVDRIAIAGISSGGNVAAATCIALRDEGRKLPVFQLLVAPAVNLDPETPSMQADADPSLAAADVHWFWSLYHGGEVRDAPATAMPCNAGSLAGLPPALVLVGAADPLADGAVDYATRLRADGTPADAIRYPGIGHAIFAMPVELGRQSVNDAAAALRRAFDAADASSTEADNGGSV